MKVDLLHHFWWAVCDGGYAWSTVFPGDDDNPLLLPKSVKAERRYRPLHEHTALFRVFAAVTPTKEGILEFANTYGNLREKEEAVIEDSEANVELATGETYNAWRREIIEMSRLVPLWDMVQRRDTASLSRHIIWSDDCPLTFDNRSTLADVHVYYDSHPQLQPNQDPEPPDQRIKYLMAMGVGIPEAWRRGSSPDHFIAPALVFIQNQINLFLQGNLSALLQRSPESRYPTLQFMPQGLSGAVWLQFAQAISGNKAYRECKECRRWFEITESTKRSDATFCLNRCRQRAYVRRMREAQTMFAAGKKIQDIARAIGSKVATVRSWVKPAKRSNHRPKR
jgi:hypothetical protein